MTTIIITVSQSLRQTSPVAESPEYNSCSNQIEGNHFKAESFYDKSLFKLVIKMRWKRFNLCRMRQNYLIGAVALLLLAHSAVGDTIDSQASNVTSAGSGRCKSRFFVFSTRFGLQFVLTKLN
jgi:hypothetical protein